MNSTPRSIWRLRWLAIAWTSAVALVVGCGEPEDPQAVPTSLENLTYSRDIAPIVFEACADCHRDGEAAPFELLTFQDVKETR